MKHLSVGLFVGLIALIVILFSWLAIIAILALIDAGPIPMAVAGLVIGVTIIAAIIDWVTEKKEK